MYETKSYALAIPKQFFGNPEAVLWPSKSSALAI
jgi:hypothetical protein